MEPVDQPSRGDSNLGGIAFGAQLARQVRQKYNIDITVNKLEVIQATQNHNNTRSPVLPETNISWFQDGRPLQHIVRFDLGDRS